MRHSGKEIYGVLGRSHIWHELFLRHVPRFGFLHPGVPVFLIACCCRLGESFTYVGIGRIVVCNGTFSLGVW
jgi:hypothetical protein